MSSVLGIEGMSPQVAKQRLVNAIQRIGVAFSDAIRIVEYDPDAETAYWKFEASTGRDWIGVGPFILGLDIDSIEMVLRHEILHRSMFHAFGERFTNSLLCNLTLDICINRLLFEAFPDETRKMSRSVYGEGTAATPLALADCTASPFQLPPELGLLWKDIWLGTGSAARNPSSLYYRLIRLGLSDDPSLERYAHGYGETAWPSTAMERAAGAVLEELDHRLPPASDLRSGVAEYVVAPGIVGTSRVDSFVRSLAVRRVLDEITGPLLEEVRSCTRIQPYPAYPSRVGLIYDAMGLTDHLHLFWNRELKALGARLALGLYVDVSGSMIPYFPFITTLVGALRDFPLRVKAFDTSLKEVEVESFSSGRVVGGGGTDFDVPLVDLMEDDAIGAGLLVTDGFAHISEGVGRRFQKSGKDVFVVYLREPAGKPPQPDPLSQFATRVLEINPGALRTR